MSILEKIYNACLKFLVPLTPEETYKTIVDEAVKLSGADEGLILLKDRDLFKTAYGSTPEAAQVKARRRGFAYRAHKKGEAFVIQSKDFTELDPVDAKISGLKSILFIPLSYKNTSLGALVLRSRKKNKIFRKKELKILQLFGSMASLSIRKAQLYNETKQALETRDLFISMAAHELRTPLTTVDGYVQLIREKMRNKKTIHASWFEDLILELNRLKQLVDEFLEINRIKTGRLQYDWKESHLRKIIKRAISTFQFSRPNRKIIFRNKLNSTKDLIIGDRNKLIQVIINVLENADKYSNPGKDIMATLRYKSPDYVLEITDKGQGIAKEEIPLIFRGFYKGKNSQHEGMGLGLYLAKNIVEDHHGSIHIRSKVGRGTNVLIKLPKVKT